MKDTDQFFETIEITEDLQKFIMNVLSDVGEAIKQRNKNLVVKNELGDASAIALTLLSMIYASCQEDVRPIFKLAMIDNIKKF